MANCATAFGMFQVSPLFSAHKFEPYTRKIGKNEEKEHKQYDVADWLLAVQLFQYVDDDDDAYDGRDDDFVVNKHTEFHHVSR